jgi:hypothetical protein
MAQLQFYALRGDLESLFTGLEKGSKFFYTRMGSYAVSVCTSMVSGNDIPQLGKASGESSTTCDTFLVTRTASIAMREIDLDGGGEHYLVDQLANPDSVTLTPGGLRKDTILISGRVATASDSQTSKDLMAEWSVAIRRSWTKVKAFYLGPAAAEFWRSSGRLTISVGASSDFDLKP